MQGIFINGKRPTSKKQVKEAIATSPDTVRLEATSLFGNEYEGPVSEAPSGSMIPSSKRYDFVGPDPYTSRKFYGNLFVSVDKDGARKVVVK